MYIHFSRLPAGSMYLQTPSPRLVRGSDLPGGYPLDPAGDVPSPDPCFRESRMSKTALIILRVTPDDKEIIESKATSCNLSTSAYLRKLARDHELQSAFDQAAVYQLKRIGRNLNQAVRCMHRGDFSDEVRESLRRCLKAFYVAMGGAE